jgi:hypothetical protein
MELDLQRLRLSFILGSKNHHNISKIEAFLLNIEAPSKFGVCNQKV